MLVEVYISEPRHEYDDEFWRRLPAERFAAIRCTCKIWNGGWSVNAS
ncbi:hypothetical protein ACFSX5_13505 [Devosia albogilva]|uniref:Transposase n=1 Tax=Devosia albogilva TaxID=429726 RepID=A0ABW5QM82_9HYPH